MSLENNSEYKVWIEALRATVGAYLVEIEGLRKKLNQQSEKLAEALREKNAAEGVQLQYSIELKQYKELFKSMDLQTIGTVLGCNVGDSVTESILPKVLELKRERDQLKDENTELVLKLAKLSPPKPKFREEQIVMNIAGTTRFPIKIVGMQFMQYLNTWTYTDTCGRKWIESALREQTDAEK